MAEYIYIAKLHSTTMSSNEINFKYTRQIDRYLDDIVSYWNECRMNMPEAQIQFAEPKIIKSYLNNEFGSKEDDDNRCKFVSWLIKENAIELLDVSIDTIHHTPDDSTFNYSEILELHVRKIEPVLELLHRFTDKKTGAERVDNGRLIFYNEGTGKFICGEGKKRLPLRVSEKELYYKYFVAIYLSASEHGDTTVSQIRSVLRSRFNVKTPVERKNIQNHINNSIGKAIKKAGLGEREFFSWTRRTDNLFFDNPYL